MIPKDIGQAPGKQTFLYEVKFTEEEVYEVTGRKTVPKHKHG